jgi:polysaccharide export outer membrane protein
LLSVAGCSLFRSADHHESGAEASLEAMLAGMVPLPFENDAGEFSEEDRADADAAAAAAADADDGNARFSKEGDPLLRSGLVIKVSVMLGDKREVQDTRVQVSDKGEITLPMVGKVSCEGLALPELRAKLETLYGNYYRQPEVAAEFIYEANNESPWGRILVMGRVKSEGWVNIPPTRGMTVSRAVQLAGGFNTSAKKNKILVTRRLADGSQRQYRVDLLAVAERGAIDKDLPLEPGDVVFVPERRY